MVLKNNLAGFLAIAGIIATIGCSSISGTSTSGTSTGGSSESTSTGGSSESTPSFEIDFPSCPISTSSDGTTTFTLFSTSF